MGRGGGPKEYLHSKCPDPLVENPGSNRKGKNENTSKTSARQDSLVAEAPVELLGMWTSSRRELV